MLYWVVHILFRNKLFGEIFGKNPSKSFETGPEPEPDAAGYPVGSYAMCFLNGVTKLIVTKLIVTKLIVTKLIVTKLIVTKLIVTKLIVTKLIVTKLIVTKLIVTKLIVTKLIVTIHRS